MKKRNKKYVPKAVKSPFIAFDLQKPICEKQAATLAMLELSHLDALVSGNGTEVNLWTIASLIEFIYASFDADESIEQRCDVMKMCKDAMAGVKNGLDRVEAGKNAGLDGDTVQAVRALYQFHKEHLRFISLKDVKNALAKAKNMTLSKEFGFFVTTKKNRYNINVGVFLFSVLS